MKIEIDRKAQMVVSYCSAKVAHAGVAEWQTR